MYWPRRTYYTALSTSLHIFFIFVYIITKYLLHIRSCIYCSFTTRTLTRTQRQTCFTANAATYFTLLLFSHRISFIIIIVYICICEHAPLPHCCHSFHAHARESLSLSTPTENTNRNNINKLKSRQIKKDGIFIPRHLCLHDFHLSFFLTLSSSFGNEHFFFSYFPHMFSQKYGQSTTTTNTIK